MLHLLDEAAPQATPALCACLRAQSAQSPAARVVLFGGPRMADAARSAGLAADAVVSVPLGRPWLAPRAALGAAGPNPSAVTAWSANSLLWARLCLPKVPATLVLLQAPTPDEVRLLRRLRRMRPFAIEAHPALAGHPIAAALPGLRFSDAAPTPIFADAAAALDMALAPALGTPSVALVGRHGDAWRGVNAAGIMDIIRHVPLSAAPRHRLLVHPRQAGLAHAKRQMGHFGRPERLLVTPLLETPWRLPADCAAVLTLAAPNGPDADQIAALPELARRGIPIIAEEDPALRLLIGDAPRARFAPAGDVPALANALSHMLA